MLTGTVDVVAQPTAAPAATLTAPAACDLAARCEALVEIACGDDFRCALDPPGRLGEFEVLQVAEASSGPGTRSWRLTLVAFAPGATGVPPVAVRVVRDSDGAASIALTAPATIDVRLPPGGEGNDLRKDAAPIDPGPDWRAVAAWIAGGLAILAGLWTGWRVLRRRRARPAPAAAPLTVEQVVERIRALGRVPVASADDVLGVFRRLSHELRRFAAHTLAAPAEALTTQELVRAIDATARGRTHGSRDRVLLEGIDRVKFGGERPEHAGRSEAIAGAIAMVRSLAHDEAPPRGRSGDVA
jgi:hypothetical protein